MSSATSETQEKVLKYNIQTPASLKARVEQSAKTEYLIQGLTPRQALSLLVGDSGLGKSPLLYQAAACVASGIPFLGRAVQQGRVLYLDCENGIAQVNAIVERISSHLGLPSPPADLYLWNYNDCSDPWQIEDLLKEIKASLVIVDPLTAIFPSIEENTAKATEAYQRLRTLMSEIGCAVIGVHHVRKSDRMQGHSHLEQANQSSWFQEARGARALINGSDVRLGVDARLAGDGLVIKGFVRVEGDLPAMHIARVLGEDGDPVGYSLIVGEQFLNNQEQQKCFTSLPDEFPFKVAKETYGKGDQATRDFLKKCIGAGILHQPTSGGPYLKVPVSPQKEQLHRAA
jgi:hypothetical protein